MLRFAILSSVVLSVTPLWPGIARAADPTAFVDTQRAQTPGKTFHGATVPFGMMMWGPNRAGYSQTYLSGSSMPPMFDNQVPVLPVATEALVPSLFDKKDGSPTRPASRESGQPGYFRATQAGGEVVELTATPRTGLARFQFADRGSGSVLFYLYDSRSSAEVVSPTELRGETTRGDVRFYFFARFDRPFSAQGSWKKATLTPGGAGADGANGVYVSFDTSRQDAVKLKIGISFTSRENARLNLETENPGWDLQAVRDAAHGLWQDKLSRIGIEGGTLAEKTAFYSNFYHMHLGPSVFSDVNGEYLGFDGRIHTTAPGHTQYANYSGWDIYRSWIQLQSWLNPSEVSDMMQSLVNDAQQAGGGMPRWPVANRETGVMEPGSATPIVSNAYAFGARSFDVASALEILDRSESDPTLRCQPGYLVHQGLEDYLAKGYVPLTFRNLGGEQAASMTLEYALGDFALSRLALELGHDDLAARYQTLSHSWRNLFNPSNKLIEPRFTSGRWLWPFFHTIGARLGFTEGNALQYTWMVPQDLRALIDAMGGDGKATHRLDRLLSTLVSGERGPHADLGNEPSFGIPWVYNWAHAPWKTQAVIRRAILQHFVHGLPGDDDLGETSSWSVWAMLGFYPAIPGVGGLTIASPLFPEAILHLDGGREPRISAPAASDGSPYVQSLALNGKALDRAWLDLSELAGSPVNELDFELGTSPNAGWASAAGSEPPSFDQP